MLHEVITNTISRFIRRKPTTLTLLITNICNARCVMCNIWQYGVSGESDLSVAQYRELLSRPLFNQVYGVTLSGGEALLRKDIIELIDVITDTLPSLKRILIGTNGLATGLTLEKIEKVLIGLHSINPKKTKKLFVQVSFDGVSKVHDNIRGPNASINVKKTLDGLIELKKKYSHLEIAATCVVQPINIDELEQVKAYLKQRDISCIFPIVCSNEDYYKNETSEETIGFSDQQLEHVKQFYLKLMEEENRFGRKVFYWDILRVLNGKPSRRNCPTMRDVLVLEPDGKIIPCLNSSEFVYGEAGKDDIDSIWFSNETKSVIKKIEMDKCSTCMFACGITYLDGLQYYGRKILP